MLAAAMPVGVVLFWAVGWLLTNGGETGLSPRAFSPAAALYIWAAAALAGFAGALMFRGRALRALEGGAARPPSPTTLGQVQGNLLIAWALVEAPALLAGVFFLLAGAKPLLLGAAAVYLLGLVRTFPRAEWFGAGDAGA
jgi:F0F1-type ATP synthase membrane subunit c/vacuolar-type H+-ATPase subunit K